MRKIDRGDTFFSTKPLMFDWSKGCVKPRDSRNLFIVHMRSGLMPEFIWQKITRLPHADMSIWHKCLGGKYDQCSSLDLNINFMVKCHLFRRRHRRRSPLLIYLYRVKKWGRKSGANRRRPTNPIFKSLAASPPPIIPISSSHPNPNWCIKGNFVIACMSPDGGKRIRNSYIQGCPKWLVIGCVNIAHVASSINAT